MAQLAIKGHPTRGKEVIEILKMLGGKVYIEEIYKGEYPDRYYFINKNDGFIHTYFSETVDILNAFQTFTLEEFFEEFPYKVGDKVLYKYGNTSYFIRKMFWEKGRILYELSDEIYSDGSSLPDTLIFDVGVAQLQPYKEETMEEIKIDIPRDYEFAGVDDDRQQVVSTKIHPQYPKTYEECCKILKTPIDNFISKGAGYKAELLSTFQKLLICRDAYWKIAGEQMGLGKPWEPDYTEGVVNTYYTIHLFNNKLFLAGTSHRSAILSFPTEEMRDAFYENFKDLIEKCKELL